MIRASRSSLPMLSEEDLIGSGININVEHYMDTSDSSNLASANMMEEPTQEDLPTFTTRCPNIRNLSFHRKHSNNDLDETVNEFLSRILSPLEKLESLDLSYWQQVEDLHCLSPHKLSTLILYDVPDLYRALDTIVQISTLRVATIRSDIYGLRCLREPLDYLGLFNCDNASHFAEIPALAVAGDRNEDQILLALEMYTERPGLLQGVLNESYQLYRFNHNLV
ncbi:unnamed protein product [Gongylonema pulchrum]|uniref:F-box/LRR-repeat protein n=1 Tax=Gongylonema pulchrum TaxID=637853 RepID=A0A183EE45_9BILA|nr:unnamed protein product [Gongylonema pulchrum]